jgi:nucleotide-binding universal stress UspA family protein
MGQMRVATPRLACGGGYCRDMGAPSTTPKLLVGVDPAKHPLDPLRLAGKLARQTWLPVVPVTVLPHRSDDEHQRAARDTLIELGRSLDAVAVEDPVVLLSSSPARALHGLSETGNAAMIVVGSTTRGPLRRVLPGGVAEQLLSGGPCPVAVAPHGYDEHEDRDPAIIGVAYDGSEESEMALDGARAVARRAGAGLRIITVVERLAFGGMPSSMTEPSASVNFVIEEELRRAHDAALAKDDGSGRVDGVFRRGHTVDVLVEQSEEVDLLLAGSRGYGPINAVLLGSTTRALAHSAACPLVIVPRGRRLELGDDDA